MHDPATKDDLRRAIKARLLALPTQTREAASRAVCQRLEAEESWQRARSVLLFAPRSDELDLWPMVTKALSSQKRVWLPAYEAATGDYLPRELLDPAKGLVAGPYGISEPMAGNPGAAVMPLDLVVVPGLAFDSRGWRLGRGKGHYDRILASVSAVTCGVAFDEQIVPAVPVEPHDVQLSFVLTPARRFAGRSTPA